MSEATAHYVRALPLSELPPGSMKGLELEGTRILISNLDGEVHAVSGVCTHEDFDLSQGIVLEGAIVCPLHLSQFDLKTGQVYNPPARFPLEVYNVKIQDETIFVEV